MITPDAVLRQKGLLREIDGRVDCDASAVIEGGTAYLYVTRESKRALTIKTLKEAFTNLPGIAKVIPTEELASYGFPQLSAGGRMSDLVIEAAPGYAFQSKIHAEEAVMPSPPGAEGGTHGYLNTDPDMNAIFVAWGLGIKSGAHVGVVSNTDVAATMARLLNLKWPPEQVGLTELLND